MDNLEKLNDLGYDVKVTSTGSRHVTYTVTISKTFTGSNLEELVERLLGEVE